MPAPLLKVDAAGINALATRLHALGNDAPNAVLRALNRSRTSVTARLVRWLNAATGVPSTRLRKSIRSISANRMAPDARVILYGGRAPLVQFSEAHQRAHLPRGGFRARMPSGHIGYFQRTPEARHRRKGEPYAPHALPITEVYGPPWTQFLTDVGLADLLKYGGERLKIELERELAYRESRAARSA